jgi:hypothetical protein
MPLGHANWPPMSRPTGQAIGKADEAGLEFPRRSLPACVELAHRWTKFAGLATANFGKRRPLARSSSWLIRVNQ